MTIEIELKDGRNVLVMCSSCKSIRGNNLPQTKQEYLKWIKFADEPEALRKILADYEISHGLCYPCAKKLYPDFI